MVVHSHLCLEASQSTTCNQACGGPQTALYCFLLVDQPNILAGAGVAGLAKGLQCSSSLRHLDLSYTQMTDTGLEALAAALAGNSQQQAAASNSPHHQPPLQQLYLGGNPDLTDAALSNLAVALASSSEEQLPQQQQDQQQGQQRQWQLDLAETGAGAGAVKALSVLPGLTQLSLFGCKLGSGASGEGEGSAGRCGTLGLGRACIAQGPPSKLHLHAVHSATCTCGLHAVMKAGLGSL